jgi:hypothetical protein
VRARGAFAAACDGFVMRRLGAADEQQRRACAALRSYYARRTHLDGGSVVAAIGEGAWKIIPVAASLFVGRVEQRAN